jgi:ribonuclease BN (tRNA processing enzyme)
MGELIILGSGTGIPSLRRGSPGLLLISERANVLVDSGSGTLRRMLEAGTTYRDVDLILYTHIHPDHISDLVPFLFACRYTDPPRQKDLTVLGGSGFKDYFHRIKDLYWPWIEPPSYRLTIEETSQNPFFFRDLTVLSKPMAHMNESVGYRIEFKDGRSVAISGDTDYCRNIIDLAFEVDLLVVECSFPEGKKIEGHLTPSLAGRVALESRCKRLILTHLYPICDQFEIVKPCAQVYQGETILAEDLMKVLL